MKAWVLVGALALVACGGSDDGAEALATGGIGNTGGATTETGGASSGGASPTGGTSTGGASTGGTASGGSAATGGSSGGGVSGGERCDYIASCVGQPSGCAAALGTQLSRCRLGTYSCGERTGWYATDGSDFPCAMTERGLDCVAASGAALRHCETTIGTGGAPSTGGVSGTGGLSTGGASTGGVSTGGAGSCAACAEGAMKCDGLSSMLLCQRQGSCTSWKAVPCGTGNYCVQDMCQPAPGG